MIDLDTTFSLIVMLMIFSALYKESIIYRIVVAIWLGAGIAYLSMEGANSLWTRLLRPLIAGTNYLLILPLIFAALLFLSLVPKLSFISRYPSAFTLGANVGLAVAGAVITQIYRQTTAAVNTPSLAIMTVWVVFIIMYFTMTIKHEGPAGRTVGYISRIGRWMLMVSFGAMFANYGIARFSQLISRIQFVFFTWLG